MKIKTLLILIFFVYTIPALGGGDFVNGQITSFSNKNDTYQFTFSNADSEPPLIQDRKSTRLNSSH